jgi:ferredoxin--NADP+ reductase
VDAAGWQRIDSAEVAAGAAVGRPRVKLTDWKALLDTAEG